MRIPTKLTLALVTLVALIAAAPAADAQTPLKVGIFDSQRISEETAEGKKVQNDLAALRDTKQQEISSKEQVINDLQQRLSQQGLSLSVEARTSLEIDIQRRLLEVNSAKDLATRELQLEVAAAEAMFNEKLRLVVQQFGRDEGFSLLLEVGTVAWASNTVDVTTAITDLFDRMYPASTE